MLGWIFAAGGNERFHVDTGRSQPDKSRQSAAVVTSAADRAQQFNGCGRGLSGFWRTLDFAVGPLAELVGACP